MGFGALLGLVATSATHHVAWGFVIVPMAMLGTMVAACFFLVAFASLAAIFGGTFYVLYRLASGSSAQSGEGYVEVDDGALTADTLLRRRYVAGEITYDQFQKGMVVLLGDRYARGTITLSAYEAELEKLIAPTRHLDVKRDPMVAGAPRGE